MKNTILVAVATVLGLTTACSRPSAQNPVDTQNASGLVPGSSVSKDANGSTNIIDQMKRFRGQTQFLTPSPYSFGPMAASARAESASAPPGAKGGSARAEQESDIYKVGKAGSKLLFLLNNYRGLQVISFAKGADQPQLLSRVKASGNYPSDMYYDEKGDRLLVLERLYYSDDGSYNYSETQSRIVVYDVSNPNDPKISAEVPVAGSIADSRMVGDVLYIASSIRPDSNAYNYGRQESPQGVVTSFDLSGKTIKEVQKAKLALPTVYGEKMSIQTVTNADGSYSYYLVAILSESGWGWWDRQSLVEVVDISDPKGKIKSVMSVSAKGTINERSQTLIKNDTLIVTSNYIIDRDARTRIARIAVETFALPKQGAKALTEKEADYRKLHMELALEGKSGTDHDTLRESLLADANLGLKGKFVATKEGSLRKLFPDSVVTVGDTRGQSSSLQDVRYQDGLLYAFWVPANQVDPLDIFDISKPEQGVKHLSRLEFDGWVSKAVPMTYGGRNYIVALGWIVPAVNNERNLRHPQATIFEIQSMGSKYRAQQVAQLTFESSDIWTDFNSPDRFIEIRQDGDGKGQILFAASQYKKNDYQSGGKILQFDLSKLATDADKAVTEGVFLAGRSGWLRRVFTNAEIDRVNTFSDQALGIFNAGKPAADKSVTATAILELARNIRNYETLKIADKTVGVQIISDWSWFSVDESETALRIVNAKAADAEKAATAELKVRGNYVASRVHQGVLYVLTNWNKSQVDDKGNWSYISNSYLHIVTLGADSKLSVANTTEWKSNRNGQVNPPQAVRMSIAGGNRYSEGNLIALPNGQLIAQIDGTIKTIKQNGATDIAYTGCTTKDRQDLQLQAVGDTLYVTSSESVKIDETSNLFASRNFAAKAVLANGTLTCDAEVNIPGKIVTAVNGAILVNDTSMDDIISNKVERPGRDNKPTVVEYKTIKTSRSLIGLTINGKQATLVDEIAKSIDDDDYRGVQLRPTKAGEVVRLTSFAEATGGGRFFAGRPGRGMRSSDAEPALEFIQVDAKGFLTSEKIALGVKGANVSLLGIERNPSMAGGYLGILNTGRKLQVIQWTDAAKRPEARKLVALDEKLKPLAAADAVATSNSYYGYGSAGYHFTPELMSFEIIEGLNGINQVFVK